MTKVLVIDDHPLITTGIKSTLSKEHKDWEIETIEKYEDAAAYKKIGDIDIALIDVRLGENSGLDLAKIYMDKFPNIKILIITSFADKGALEKSISMGVKGFLLKTRQIGDLVQAIEIILSGELFFPKPKLSKEQYELIMMNDKIHSLSKRQRMLINLISEGLTNKEIAEEMYVSEKTVKNYLTVIYKKIDCKSRSEATSFMKRYQAKKINLSNKSEW